MIATLDAWLSESGRLKSVAARLGVHRNTVSYRIARLREILGEDFDGAERRLKYQVACYIDQQLSAPNRGSADS